MYRHNLSCRALILRCPARWRSQLHWGVKAEQCRLFRCCLPADPASVSLGFGAGHVSGVLALASAVAQAASPLAASGPLTASGGPHVFSYGVLAASGQQATALAHACGVAHCSAMPPHPCPCHSQSYHSAPNAWAATTPRTLPGDGRLRQNESNSG
jgi:hypothetical protein